MFIFLFIICYVIHISLYTITQILKVTGKSDTISCSKKEITGLILKRFFRVNEYIFK